MSTFKISRELLARIILGDDEVDKIGFEAAAAQLATWTMDDYRKLPVDVRKLMGIPE